MNEIEQRPTGGGEGHPKALWPTLALRHQMVFEDAVLFNGGPPSNFHIAPITLPDPWTNEEFTFEASEVYYQAAKGALVLKPRGAPNGSGAGLGGNAWSRYLMIRNSLPLEAKKLANKHHMPMTDEQLEIWNGSRAMLVMLRCCLAKFQQNETCRDWLLATGDRLLIEHRPDPIWGDNIDGTGKNQLGHVLMLVRASLR